MSCPCGSALCDCGRVCHCCYYHCYCMQCVHIRFLLRTQCCPCGGRGPCPYYTESNSRTRQDQSTSTPPGRAIRGRFKPESTQSSSTASQRCVPEASPSPPESPTFDDTLQFQMDDIDTSPPKAPTNTASNINTGAKSKIFRGSSHFSSNRSVSGTVPFEQNEPSSRVRRCDQHSIDTAGLKSTKSSKFKMPVSIPLSKIDITDCKLKEPQKEMPISTQDGASCSHHNPSTSASKVEELTVTGAPPLRTLAITDSNRTELLEREISTTIQDVPGSSHHNPNACISKFEECQDTEISSVKKLGATSLKWTESHESEIMTTKDIPGCSHQYISKQEESQISDNASDTVSLSADEYASESLPSTPSSDNSLSSSCSVSPPSPTPILSTSAPAIYDLPEPKELKSSEQKPSTALGSSEPSSTSNLNKTEALSISDSLQIDKSRTSSETSSSIEVLAENMPNGARYDTFHGQPGIPSNFLASSQLNNAVMQAESAQPGTSQTLPTSNLPKLPSPEKLKSPKRRTSSELDSSIETASSEQVDDNSEDEALTNKSPKKKNK